MLIFYRKQLDEKKIRLDILEIALNRHSRELLELKKELNTLTETRDIFQRASILTQNYLAEHLASIVTKALRMVWNDRAISFRIEFVERRNTTECDMWIEENNHKYSLLNSRGYGVVDVVSFSLKVAYIMLHNVDNIAIIDEPFRNVSKENHETLSMLVKNLAEELDMQFIIATHSPDLIAYADKSFEIVNGSLKD